MLFQIDPLKEKQERHKRQKYGAQYYGEPFEAYKVQYQTGYHGPERVHCRIGYVHNRINTAINFGVSAVHQVGDCG